MEKSVADSFPRLVRVYVSLTKPGIIMGNMLTAAVGFTLASRNNFDFWLFLSMIEGLALIIASSCVFNNYIDREIDAKMERTKNRALVLKKVPNKNALIFATFLGVLGILILSFLTNLFTAIIAILGVAFYVIAYTFSKYYTIHGTLIGSIAGATPPVVGYCAVTNHFDMGAFLLFLLITWWQMPHFYAIAINRINDYKNASLPMYPIKKGINSTKVQMLLYIIIFTFNSGLLTFYGYTDYLFCLVVTSLGFVWTILSIKGFKKLESDSVWARKMFIFSLIIVMSICIVTPFSV